MREKLRIACEPDVVRRALFYAAVVGCILIAINHGDAILRGDFGQARLAKMGLTVLVPYLVSTLSSVGTISQMRKSNARKQITPRV
ncbi:MAG: nitrate/nitrite transporter NrtS [bacterium]